MDGELGPPRLGPATITMISRMYYLWTPSTDRHAGDGLDNALG